MPRRSRKLIGTCIILIFLGAYSIVAMLVAQSDSIRHMNGFLQAIFFAVVGLGWILPLMPLIRWMERPDPEEPGTIA